SGHNIIATVAIEAAGSMFRAGGVPELRPVGETEFLNGAAAMSASGRYGPTRIAAGIVGFADLRLGHRVEPILEAHISAGGGRLRGVRMPASWCPSTAPELLSVSHIEIPPQMLLDPKLHEGLACVAKMGLTFDTYVYHSQLEDVLALARAVPQATIIINHCG